MDWYKVYWALKPAAVFVVRAFLVLSAFAFASLNNIRGVFMGVIAFFGVWWILMPYLDPFVDIMERKRQNKV